MPRKTDGEKIDDLEKTSAALTERLDNVRSEVKALDAGHSEAVKTLGVIKTEMVLLKREIDELRKWQDDAKKGKEEWGRKWWLILPPLIAAVLSSILTASINYWLKN